VELFLWLKTIHSSKANMQQVHADASNFAEDITKEEAYKQVLEAAEVLFEEQRNWVRLLSIIY
jgi:hypothetical protein